MMHNSYASSKISLRTSFSFNGYSYYSNERCPSSCFCCSCPNLCNSSRLTVPINPSLLYGLRQSTLIQLPPSRRLVLGSADKCYYRSPVCNVGQFYCGEPCCIKQERVDRFVERICTEDCCVKKRSVSCVNESRSRMGRRNYRCSVLGDAEAMLSLLSEECLDVRGRIGRSVKEGKPVQKENAVSEKSESRRENVGLESELKKVEVDRGRVQSGEEVRREEIKDFSRDDGRWSRRGESSSSYHTISDLDDFGSDIEVHITQGGFDRESSFKYDEDSRGTEDERDSRRNKHEMDSRRTGGIVIREEREQDSSIYRDQQLQSSTHDDFKLGNSAEWDYRKKSEKKLSEESVEETKSKKVSVVKQSQLSHTHESNTMKASSSKKQSNYQEGESSSGASFHLQSNSNTKTDNQVSENLKSSTTHEQLVQAHRNEVESTSDTWRISNQEETVMLDAKSAQEAGCEYCEECGGIMKLSKTQIDFQQQAELSETQVDAGLSIVELSQSGSQLVNQENSSTSLQDSFMEASRIENKSESKFKMQEISSTSHQTSVMEGSNEHHQVLHAAFEEFNTENKSQHQSGTVGHHGRYAESTSISQKQSETRIKNLEEYSTSVVSKQEVKGLQEESSCKIIEEFESNKKSQTGSHSSQVHSTNVEINRQSLSDQRIYSEQTYLMSKAKSIEKIAEKHYEIDETSAQLGPRTEEQLHVLPTSCIGDSSGDSVVIRPSIASVSPTDVEQVNEGETKSDLQIVLVSQTDFEQVNEEEAKTDLQIVVLSPLYKCTEERSPCGEPSTSSVSNDAGSNTEIGTSVAFVESQARTCSSSLEGSRNERKSFEEPSSEDALDSTEHLDSVQIVGEFVEKMNHEVSTSDTKMEKKLSQRNSKDQDEKYLLKGSSQSASLKINLQKQDPRDSSDWSETKQPSDEMPSMKSHLPQESSEKELSESTTSENVVAKRTGKSLWNILAGVFKLRWGSQSETQTSPIKSGDWSSSNESASSETGVSKNGANDANVDSLEKQRTSMPQKPAMSDQTPLRRNSTRIRRGSIGVLGSDDNIGNVGVGASPSSSVLQSGLLLGVISIEANNSSNITQKIPQSTSPLDLSINPSKRSRRLHTSGEIEVVSRIEDPVSSSEEQRKHSPDVKQAATVINDVDRKQRKLQRSDQVLQETFDKWEDAYRLENEQRKIDEFFMREALVEAKKAADSWEVPVGAVLVQNGEIIARGYNLVEELRDSTAHAEIICIREGSGVLRTWRLSESTLYVTLEPCPMCAGAILQARIGTLVWGAPNKLLGADGSWIRLFPEGAEGEQRPEVADKPAAPIHPFHPKMNIRRGILQSDCSEIMQQFFQLRRKKKKQEKKSEEPRQPSSLPIPHHTSNKLLHKIHDIFHIVFCM